MEFIGEIKSISRPIGANTIDITFSTDNNIIAEYGEIKDLEKLTIKVSKFRKKRGINANNYAWKLMSSIAEVLKTSKEEIYEQMLEKYGTNVLDDDGDIMTITVPAKSNIKYADIHCAYIGKGTVNGKIFNHYRLIKGTSLYDTKEMSIFIDGVVSEAKDLEIETLTPNEIEKMKVLWGTL